MVWRYTYFCNLYIPLWRPKIDLPFGPGQSFKESRNWPYWQILDWIFSSMVKFNHIFRIFSSIVKFSGILTRKSLTSLQWLFCEPNKFLTIEATRLASLSIKIVFKNGEFANDFTIFFYEKFWYKLGLLMMIICHQLHYLPLAR